jgi:hypothetical protein
VEERLRVGLAARDVTLHDESKFAILPLERTPPSLLHRKCLGEQAIKKLITVPPTSGRCNSNYEIDLTRTFTDSTGGSNVEITEIPPLAGLRGCREDAT